MPPKNMAEIISQIVFSMLSIPPRESRLSNAALPVLEVYPFAATRQMVSSAPPVSVTI